jgi:tetratricopeptide (TPR) repeat protein
VTRALALLLALFVVTPLAAAEKWYDWYNKGVASVRNAQYKDGADALQRAIAEMPNETTSARAGNVIITYVPHFWLGIARFNLGEVDAALREWKTSEEQGAIQNTQYLGSLRDWVARANSQKERNAESGAAESRKAADAAIGRALAGQTDALRSGADRSDAYRSALRKLQEAVDGFNRAGNDVAAYRRVADTATQARDLFNTTAEAARKERAARPAAPAPKPQPRDIVIPFPADNTPPRTQTVPATQTAAPRIEPPKPQSQSQTQTASPPGSPPAPESETLVGARVAVQTYKRHLLDAKLSPKDARLLETQLESSPSDAVSQRVKADVERGEKALAARMARIAPPPLPVPQPPANPVTAVSSLEPAWRAYASGDFARADALLSALVSAKATPDAYLLRGITRWTRASLVRKGDVTSAAEDFRAALKLNPALHLDPAAFSPKVIAFYESIRAGR